MISMQPAMSLPDPEIMAAFLGIILIAMYVAYAYNDLTIRLERLKALMADVGKSRDRRQGVHKSVSGFIGTATRHERNVVGRAVRRNKGGGRFISITDNGNGWPTANAVGTTEQGLSADVNSHNMENQAWVQLHHEAEEYNALLRSFPRCLFAFRMGFRPWRMGNRQNPRRFRRRP
jgi:hypothetical protein